MNFNIEKCFYYQHLAVLDNQDSDAKEELLISLRVVLAKKRIDWDGDEISDQAITYVEKCIGTSRILKNNSSCWNFQNIDMPKKETKSMTFNSKSTPPLERCWLRPWLQRCQSNSYGEKRLWKSRHFINISGILGMSAFGRTEKRWMHSQSPPLVRRC